MAQTNMRWVRILGGMIEIDRSGSTVASKAPVPGERYALMPAHEAAIAVTDKAAVYEVPAGFNEGFGPPFVIV